MKYLSNFESFGRLITEMSETDFWENWKDPNYDWCKPCKYKTDPKKKYDCVYRIQKYLTLPRVDGYKEYENILAPYGVDGKYGPKTCKAISLFQFSNGLQVDGCWGPETQRKFKELYGEDLEPCSQNTGGNNTEYITGETQEDILGNVNNSGTCPCCGSKIKDTLKVGNRSDCFNQEMYDKNKGARCTQEFKPVVGCDGRIYSNECAANCSGIVMIRYANPDEYKRN